MPMRRENVAAALRYLGNQRQKVRERLERATSLDPQEQDLADIAVETAAGFIPGVGQALAARDVERARRANDPAGMAMAAASAIPGERLARLLGKFDPTRLELDVYQGSPYRFEPTPDNPFGEFDSSKIGTGEGAQAYGYGHYLAESQGVGEGYRDATSASKPSQASFLRMRDQEPMGSEVWNYYDKLAKQRVASLYKADLPDEMIDRMLDWDKPLSQQPESVRKGLTAIAKTDEQLMEKLKGLGPDATADMAYSALTEHFVRRRKYEQMLKGIPETQAMPSLEYGQAKASEWMRSVGIPGIKYADAGSRGQGGSGTRNFVVFPGEEKKVRILERK